MYKLIIFDADDTLFDYDRAERFALQKALTENGFDGEFEPVREIYREINFKMWSDMEKGIITKDRLRTERFRLLFERMDYKINGNYDIENFSNTYLFHLSKAAFLLEGAEDICRYLSSQYRLAILTNGIKDVQLSRLKLSPINNFFEDIIISDEVGINKPDPKIFEYTLNRLGHRDKRTVLMVGDSLSSDIYGGINFGVDTCWVNLKKREAPADIRPKFTVESLEALRDII